jgi:hypothetical protein
MASDKEIQNQKELNRLKKEENQILKDRLSLNDENIQDQRDISNEIKSITKDIKFQKQEQSELNSIGKVLNKLTQSTANLNKESIGTFKGINDVVKQRFQLQATINQLSSLEGNITELNVEQQEALNSAIRDQIGSAEDVNAVLEEQLKFSEKIAETTSVKSFQGISNFVKQIPGLKQLASPFEDAASAAREIETTRESLLGRKDDINKLKTGKGLTAEVIKRLGLEKQITATGTAAARQAKKQGIVGDLQKDLGKIPSSFSGITAGIKSLGSTFSKGFGGAVIAAVTDEFFLVNEQTVELQKSLALSADEAADLRNDFADAATSSGNINVSTTSLLKTVTALSKQFGFPTLFDMETLVTTTKLTEQVGISAESAGMLAAATVTTGKNFEDQYKDALGTSYELQRQSGVQLDLRNILEESGKVTGTIRANLGANVKTIAAAVTQAKLFGGSLNDVANASKSLLDFESSISAELEAELLLGKNINLEKARQASLDGDLATVAKELTKEAGDYNDFQNLNVIQQEALAKAMGMQSDQLADILFQQDIQNKTASELRALGKNELADRLEAQTAQEKFTKSVEKLKGLLGDLVTTFMPILDILGYALEGVGALIKLLGPLSKVLAGVATGAAAGSIIPGLGTLAGAIGGGVVGAMSLANDAIVPTTGYGDTIIKSGKDTLALNNEDSVAVVAGTNLGGGSNKTGERTNQLLESLIMQNSKKPELSPVGLYEVQ